MTQGLFDDRTSVPNPEGYESGFQLYGSTRQWAGSDRLYPKMPYKGTRTHRIAETVVRRVEGHVTYETVQREVAVPLLWDTKSLAEREDYLREHPYSVDFESRNLGTCYFDVMVAPYLPSGSPRYGSISGFGMTPGYPGDQWGPEDEQKLIDALRRRVNGSDFNLASFLGAEGIDTVKWLGNTATRIYRSLLLMKKGKVNAAMQVLRYASNGRRRNPLKMPRVRLEEQKQFYRDWLQTMWRDPDRRDPPPWYAVGADQWLNWHLAAAPLLGDVKAAAEQLAHRLDVPQRKAYSVDREVIGQHGITNSGLGAVWGENTVRHRAKLKYVVEELPTWLALSGLPDPEVVLWEATPLSFVADWITPVGNWLGNRALASSLHGIFVKSVLTDWRFSKLHAGPDTNGYGLAYIVSSPGSHYLSGSFHRTVSATLPLPGLEFTPLGAFKSWQRATTAVALLQTFAANWGTQYKNPWVR